MLETVAAAFAILEPALKFFRERKQADKAKVREYIEDVVRACYKIVQLDDPTSDMARLIHHRLKSFEPLPESLAKSEYGEVVRNAVVGARMYYWARILADSDETKFWEVLQEWSKSDRLFVGSRAAVARDVISKLPESDHAIETVRDAIKEVRDDYLTYMGNLKTRLYLSR